MKKVGTLFIGALVIWAVLSSHSNESTGQSESTSSFSFSRLFISNERLAYNCALTWLEAWTNDHLAPNSGYTIEFGSYDSDYVEEVEPQKTLFDDGKRDYHEFWVGIPATISIGDASLKDAILIRIQIPKNKTGNYSIMEYESTFGILGINGVGEIQMPMEDAY